MFLVRGATAVREPRFAESCHGVVTAMVSWLLRGGKKPAFQNGHWSSTMFNDANGGQQMLESRDEWIKKRAYAIWEEEGYPSGRDTMHWEQASNERIALEKSDGKDVKISAKSKVKRKPTVAVVAVASEPAPKPAAKLTSKKAAVAKV